MPEPEQEHHHHMLDDVKRHLISPHAAIPAGTVVWPMPGKAIPPLPGKGQSKSSSRRSGSRRGHGKAKKGPFQGAPGWF